MCCSKDRATIWSIKEYENRVSLTRFCTTVWIWGLADVYLFWVLVVAGTASNKCVLFVCICAAALSDWWLGGRVTQFRNTNSDLIATSEVSTVTTGTDWVLAVSCRLLCVHILVRPLCMLNDISSEAVWPCFLTEERYFCVQAQIENLHLLGLVPKFSENFLDFKSPTPS